MMPVRIVEAAGGNARGLTIGVLGVTFEPNTDDIRDAPSLVVVPTLIGKGASVKVYDPKGRANAERLLDDVQWCDTAIDVARDVDVLVVLTEWNEFRALDLKSVAALMRGGAVVDLRNVFNPEDAAAAGLWYHSVGRPAGDTRRL